MLKKYRTLYSFIISIAPFIGLIALSYLISDDSLVMVGFAAIASLVWIIFEYKIRKKGKEQDGGRDTEER